METSGWKDGKRWVYSITYDEGCADLLTHALPIHRRYGVPGHVALLASQIGVPRQVPGSTYNGMLILSKTQVRQLCREGWGVSCHGMTHAAITPANADYEVVQSRQTIESVLEMPVKMFCVPNNHDSYPAARAVAETAGYDSVLTIVDDLNTQDSDLMLLHRCPLHTQYPAPFYSAFDPYKRLHQAIDRGGWVIDYCHCPMPGRPVHPAKDCTTEELEQRFRTVSRLGGDDVWLAEPTEVVAWLLACRRRPNDSG